MDAAIEAIRQDKTVIVGFQTGLKRTAGLSSMLAHFPASFISELFRRSSLSEKRERRRRSGLKVASSMEPVGLGAGSPNRGGSSVRSVK